MAGRKNKEPVAESDYILYLYIVRPHSHLLCFYKPRGFVNISSPKKKLGSETRSRPAFPPPSPDSSPCYIDASRTHVTRYLS